MEHSIEEDTPLQPSIETVDGESFYIEAGTPVQPTIEPGED